MTGTRAPVSGASGRRVVVTAGLAALYFAAGKMGLGLAQIHASASAVWPPTGIAMASLALLGAWAWPGVFLGAFLVNWTTEGNLLTSCGIGLGNTLEGLLGAAVIRAAPGLDRARDVFRFAALAAGLCTMASATVGVTTLAAGGFAPWTGLPSIWFTWWLGDATGAILVAPLILSWCRGSRLPDSRAAAAEAGLMFLLVGGAACTVFFGAATRAPSLGSLGFLLFPGIAWIAYRFRQRGATAAVALMSLVSLAGTLRARGPFGACDPNEALLLQQAFIGTCALTALVIAALVRESAAAEATLRAGEERLRLLNAELESRVRSRTRELEAAHEEVRNNESRLREAQRIAHLGSWEWDVASGRVVWTDELYRIFGLAPGEVGIPPRGFFARVHPEDRRRVLRVLAAALRRRRSFRVEYRILRPDGQVRAVLGHGHVVLEDGERRLRMAGTVQDVTERRQMETQLAFADRWASMGALAGGMAHEINNPLSYVIANLDLLAEAPAAGGARDLIVHAREGAERVRNIVRDLQTFSTRERKRGPVDLHAVLDLSANIAGNEIRPRARLVKEYGSVPCVEGDETRLGQVFVNLLVNAAKAIPEGHAAEHEVRIVTANDGDGRVRVEVRDSGAGIPEADRERIFEPFFTTRASGGGSGLGLAICRSIVVSLGGEISVQSEVGRGSAFRVVLPASSLPAPAPRPPQVVEPVPPGRVLVVDDEPRVAAALRRLLQGEHEVVVATHPREALERIRRGEFFDVIFCDLLMPDMSGMDLHAELRRIAPQAAERMVFVTGGAFTPRSRSFLESAGAPWVEKPFDGPVVRNAMGCVMRHVAAVAASAR